MLSLVEMADAVVTDLNAQAWSEEFTAIRDHNPIYDIKELTDLVVTVVPVNRKSRRITRKAHEKDIEIDIGFHQKLTAVDNDTIDPLVDLVEEVADHFTVNNRLASLPEAFIKEVKMVPVDPKTLTEKRTFLGVVMLLFRADNLSDV